MNNIARLTLLCVFLVCFVYCSSSSLVEATSSSCRSPADTSSSSAKRGATVLHQSEMEEIIESELLSLHAEGLNAEDMEYLALLTQEQINTLGFGRRLRRAFRRVGRIVRRIGRAVARIAKGLLRGVFRLFRRRSRAIIENSVANFNGYTGPHRDTLESRRPFVGGGAQRTAVAAAVVLRRRRGFGRRFLRAVRRLGNAAKRAHFGVRGAVRAVRRFGRAALRKINEQSLKRRGKVGRFFSAISRTIAKRSMKKKMEALENQEPAANGKPVNCVACRVDCLKEYGTVDGGSMFSSCGQRYYYYGCQAVSPCFQTKTASDDEIEGMVGICAYRNGCKFKSKWRLVGENQIVTDRLVGRIRASGQNPE